MTTKVSLAPVRRDLQAVHQQFEQWRRTRRPGTPIPAPLWAAAVAVGRRHGWNRTAGALHLDAHKLRLLAGAPASGPRPVVPPAFIELPTAPPAHGCECMVELEGPRGGRLRIALRGAAPPDLVALSRVVWGGGA
jgi:hypothetical protein